MKKLIFTTMGFIKEYAISSFWIIIFLPRMALTLILILFPMLLVSWLVFTFFYSETQSFLDFYSNLYTEPYDNPHYDPYNKMSFFDKIGFLGIIGLTLYWLSRDARDNFYTRLIKKVYPIEDSHNF